MDEDKLLTSLNNIEILMKKQNEILTNLMRVFSQYDEGYSQMITKEGLVPTPK